METRTCLKGATFAAALWTTQGASIALKHVPEATATSATGMANASMAQQNACVTRDGSGVRARSALQRARASTASSAPGTGRARLQDSAKQTASATRATSGRRASASASAARPIRARDTANVGLTGPALRLPREPPPRLMQRARDAARGRRTCGCDESWRTGDCSVGCPGRLGFKDRIVCSSHGTCTAAGAYPLRPGRDETRPVSTGGRDETCPVSTRRGGGGGRAAPATCRRGARRGAGPACPARQGRLCRADRACERDAACPISTG
jgi:hypothetical protein